MSETLSAAEARRIALAAQGLDKARREKITTAQMCSTTERLALHQIDSVNVLVRAHYLPLFSRVGAYSRAELDNAAWGRKRRLFE